MENELANMFRDAIDELKKELKSPANQPPSVNQQSPANTTVFKNK